MVDDAVTRVNEKYEKRRVDVLKRHEDELTALQVNMWLFLLVFSENLWGFILWMLAEEFVRLNSNALLKCLIIISRIIFEIVT